MLKFILKNALIMWLVVGILNLFMGGLTLEAWFFGGGLFFIGGGCVVYVFYALLMHAINTKVETVEYINAETGEHRKFTPPPLETIVGEFVEEIPVSRQLPEPRPRIGFWKPKRWVDPIYCPECQKVTWQELPEDEHGNWNHTYVCGCGHVKQSSY